MGKLIYLMTTSLDGYMNDKNGDIDFTEPSEEVHLFINDILKDVGTFLFGRRMYETMAVWDTLPTDGDSEAMNQFAKFWKTTTKIVYSKTLSDVTTVDTTLEHELNLESVKKLIAESDKDVEIGGPHLASDVVRVGLIDEYHQFIAPTVIGGGTRWLPEGMEIQLELVETKSFENGTVYLHYVKKKG